jgi:hypothetical protein
MSNEQRTGDQRVMQTIETMNQAAKLFAQWAANGSNGFWLDFYEQQSGHEFGSDEYDLVANMVADGLLK